MRRFEEGDSTPSFRISVENDIIISLAGPIAEHHLTGRRNNVGARFDYEHAITLALRLCGTSESATAYLKWLDVRTRQVITAERNWCAVGALARAFVEEKRIVGTRAWAIIADAILPNRNERLARLVAQAKRSVVVVADEAEG